MIRWSLMVAALVLSSACGVSESPKSQVERDTACESYRLSVNAEAWKAGSTPYAFINCKDGGASRYDPDVMKRAGYGPIR